MPRNSLFQQCPVCQRTHTWEKRSSFVSLRNSIKIISAIAPTFFEVTFRTLTMRYDGLVVFFFFFFNYSATGHIQILISHHTAFWSAASHSSREDLISQTRRPLPLTVHCMWQAGWESSITMSSPSTATSCYLLNQMIQATEHKHPADRSHQQQGNEKETYLAQNHPPARPASPRISVSAGPQLQQVLIHGAQIWDFSWKNSPSVCVVCSKRFSPRQKTHRACVSSGWSCVTKGCRRPVSLLRLIHILQRLLCRRHSPKCLWKQCEFPFERELRQTKTKNVNKVNYNKILKGNKAFFPFHYYTVTQSRF